MIGAPALSSPQAAIVESLAGGPRRTQELMRVCGKGRDYVWQAIHRLNRRGCDVRRLGPRASHHGGVYVAVSIPWIREVLCRPRCALCGSYLAADHADALVCSPCEVAMLKAS